MKYVTYLIFVVFIAVLLALLKNALEPGEEPVRITGTPKCGECHQLKMEGDQLTIWKTSRHSIAFISLQSTAAVEFAKRNNIAEPVKNETCLRCHTTAVFLGNPEQENGYKPEEGVGCEACHGAGSHYSPAEIMKDEALFIKHGGEKSSVETCMKCHSLHANTEQKLSADICPFQKTDFVYKEAFEKIKHPVNRENFK